MEFSRTGTSEDVVLMMMSNTLKEIASDYNVFVYTGTQVNLWLGKIPNLEMKIIWLVQRPMQTKSTLVLLQSKLHRRRRKRKNTTITSWLMEFKKFQILLMDIYKK